MILQEQLLQPILKEVSDTSGGIYINKVTEDVTVKNDGSGGVTVQNIEGKLRR